MRTLGIALVLGLALGLAACIVATTHHTIYLEPDGSVQWAVLQEDVRSEAAAVADRDREECEWLGRALAGDHGIARGLALLGAAPAVRVLRERRPFAIWTEARFDSAEQLVRALLEGLGLPARLTFEAGPGSTGFVVELDLGAVEELADPAEELFDLLAGIEDAQLVLVEGEFTAADGFVLDDDRRVAHPVAPPDDLLESRRDTLRWELRWSSFEP